MYWEETVREAMLAEGIAREVADKLITGIIDDVVSEERRDAASDARFEESMVPCEHEFECCAEHG